MKISADQKRKIAKVAKKYGLKLVLLFGSFASGQAREESDCDVAVLTEKNGNIGDLENCKFLEKFIGFAGTHN